MPAADAPIRSPRKVRPRRTTARGPQGLPTQSTSTQRKVRPAPRPRPLPARGPQGLPGPRSAKPTPTVRRARSQVIQRRAQQRFGFQSFQKKERQTIQDVASLRAQRKAEDAARTAKLRKMVGKDRHNTGFGGALQKAAGFVVSHGENLVSQKSRSGPLGGALHESGLPGDRVQKEAIDLIANMPSSAYLAGHAAVKAAGGDSREASKLWKDYKKTSAIPAALSGNWKEAAKRAGDRPLSTALEISGFKAGLGRGAGAVMRSGVTGGVAKRAASLERPNLRLYADAKPGEGPEIRRTYSRDVINKAAQRAGEKRTAKGSRVRKHGPNKGTQRRVARDPNVDRGQAIVPGLPRSLGGAASPLGQPTRRNLIRRVDTRVFAHERARRARKEKVLHEVSDIVPAPRHSRYIGASRKGIARHDEGAGVQLVAEGVARARTYRRDLRVRLGQLAKEANRLKQTGADPERLRLNREEAAHIRELIHKDDASLGRITEAAKAYGAHQEKVQARGRKVGAFDEVGQAKRFYPALQTHVRRPASVERRPLTASEKQVAAKTIERRLRRGKAVPDKLAERIAAPARERVPVRHDVGPSKIDARSLEVMAKELGIKDPIVIRDLTKGMRERGTRAGNVQRRTADGRPVHVVYLDAKHGAGAQNRALLHELQHLADREKGTPFASTRGLTDKQYRALPTEQRAEGFANRMSMRERDLTSPPTARDLVTRRPKVGQTKSLKRGDVTAALERVRRTERVPGGKLNQDELATVSRVLQRRARRGQPTLSGMPESGPTLVTQRPVNLRPDGADRGLYQPNFPLPREPHGARTGVAFEQGAREVGSDALLRQALTAETHVTATEGFQLVAREFGRPAAADGRRYASSREEALAVARSRTHDPVTGQLRPGETELVPVNVAAFRTFGARLRRHQEEAAGSTHPELASEQRAFKATWDAALGESGRGRWILMPKDVVDRFLAHANVREHGAFRGITNVFKDVVLTTSSPAHWIGGNVADIGMRTAFEGITPLDVLRGYKISARTATHGLQGEQAVSATTGGGLYHASEALGRQFKASVRNETAAGQTAKAPYRLWKAGVYNLEHAIEEIPQWGGLGKMYRREHGTLAREMADEDVRMKADLKSLTRTQDRLIDEYARRLGTDRALEAQVQAFTENVMGRWGKISPTMRQALLIAPFAQWLGAATRYVFITLPAHHPIKTGLMTAIGEMTLEERKRLGLSYLLPRNQQVYDYQMGALPTSIGQNKYGPVISGPLTSRLTSFGTAAMAPNNLQDFLLPQLAGPLDALAGQSFTGERLNYPDWWPDASLRRTPIPPDELRKIALGSLIEAVVPFASAFRRSVLEQGRPSEPSSTILTPRTRKKFDKATGGFVDSPATRTGGIIEWLTPYTKGKLYTYGAAKQIQESGITGETLDRWRQSAKKAKQTRSRVGVPLRDPSAVAPSLQQSGGVINLRGAEKPKPKASATPSGVINLR